MKRAAATVGATAALCPLLWLAAYVVAADGPLVACLALAWLLVTAVGLGAVRIALHGARAARRHLT